MMPDYKDAPISALNDAMLLITALANQYAGDSLALLDVNVGEEAERILARYSGRAERPGRE